MRAGKDDSTNIRVAVCTINQLFQLFGHRGIKQRMRAAVDVRDEDRAAVFDIDVTHGPGRFGKCVHHCLQHARDFAAIIYCSMVT